MIDVWVTSSEGGVQGDYPVERISDALDAGESLLWVDVVDPTPDELRLIADEFQFHPLAMEDAVRLNQRPKVDFYKSFMFIVFYVFEMEDERLQARQLSIFAGKNFLVTVHDAAMPAVSETAERWRNVATRSSANGVDWLLHTLLDAVVDGYFPVVDLVSDRIDDLESQIFNHYQRGVQQEIFTIRRDLLAVRRVLSPERDVMNVLLRPGSPVLGDETSAYFQDVYDHILRIIDAIDIDRDLLSSALDAYLSVTSNRLNQTMKTLTASSIILMTMTLVAGVYGMNFVHMPELTWEFGYAWALALMAAIAVVFIVIFRRIDWI